MNDRSALKTAVSKGFTIVELLVVIVVIAILAAITIIAYNGIQSQAKATAFVSAIDAYEKEFRLYNVENSGFYPATKSTAYKPPDYSNPQSYYTLAKMHVCLPGSYPASGVFGEGECLVQYQTATYQGDTQPSYVYKLVYDVDSALTTEMNAHPASSKLPSVPLDWGGYSFSYSYTVSVTQEEAASMGISNPHAGTLAITAEYGARGVSVLGADSNNASAVLFIYYLSGDQPCGRGTKTVQDIGDLIQSQGQAEGISDYLFTVSTQKVTTCSLVIR